MNAVAFAVVDVDFDVFETDVGALVDAVLVAAGELYLGAVLEQERSLASDVEEERGGFEGSVL